MKLNEMGFDLSTMPDAKTVFECLQERHCYAKDAESIGLNPEEIKRLTVIAERQEQLIGGQAYLRLVGLHTLNVSVMRSDKGAIEQTMFDFAKWAVDQSPQPSNETMKWWHRFVGEIEPLVYGPKWSER